MLKQRKNKKFSYKSRFSKDNLSEVNFEKDANSKKFLEKWQRERKANQTKSGRGLSLGPLIIILVLLLICMYMLRNKFM